MSHHPHPAPGRRRFLGALASAVAAGVAPSAPPAPLERPPVAPPNHPAHGPALTALDGALTALAAFRDDCCGDGPRCHLCLDAGGAEYVLGHTYAMLAGEFSGRPGPGRPARRGAPHEGCVLALLDALDALLDLSAFHCAGEESCAICEEADDGLYGVRVALDMLASQLVLTPAVHRRLWRSAARLSERERRLRQTGGGFLPNAAAEHENRPRRPRAAADPMTCKADTNP